MPVNRIVRVATVTQDGISREPPAQLVDDTIERLAGVAAFQPDIVCLPECFPGHDPQNVPGAATARVSAWAKAQQAYVICPLIARLDDGRVCNSAVLIGRDGEIAGRYDKINLTEGPIEKEGQTPGPLEPPVFETDFGVIGIQICFDVNWHAAWSRLKEKGAEVVFWPSAYSAERQLSALAWMNEFFVVSSSMNRPSRVFDISGAVISQSGRFRPWATASLCLDKRLFEIDYQIQQTRDIEAKYGDRVKIEWFHEEDWFTLESLDSELTVQGIIDEFGLVPKRKYHIRCEKKNNAARPESVLEK